MLDYLGFALAGIRGVVSDATTDDPVAATVTVTGHDAAGSWVMSDPEVGDYHRMIAAGLWDLQFAAWGYEDASVPGQLVDSIDASLVVDVALAPAADAVRLSGLISDATSGAAVPSAAVELVGSPLAPRIVGADGRYRFAAVLPGTYELRAVAWGYEPAIASGVVVGAGGGDLEIDLGLLRSSGTRVLQGTVSDQATALAVADASITLVLAPAPSRRSDLSGAYDFGAVPAGSWVMACSKEGYHREVVEDVVVAAGSGAVVQDFVLRPIIEVSLSGTVRNAATGTAIGGAQISLSGASVGGALSDASGSYSISGLIDGSYQLQASAVGFATLQSSIVLTAADEEFDLQLLPVCALLNEDFELADGGLVASGSWQWGEDGMVGAASGSTVWGTVLGGDYVNSAWWTLDSPAVAIPADAALAQLRFQHWYETEPGWDGGNVSLSADGGSWLVIDPVGGYPDDDVDGLGNGVSGYSGSKMSWSEAVFDLSAYAGQSVVIRFSFGSDQSLRDYRGWYLDDLVVESAGGESPALIFADDFETGALGAWSPSVRR